MELTEAAKSYIGGEITLSKAAHRAELERLR